MANASMPSLGRILQPEIDPFESVATDLYLMQQAADSPGSGTLRIYSFPRDVLSLGRYHFAPDAAPPAGPGLARRLGGGRVLPAGTGFVGVSLVLPHRSALVADEPFALAPHQVLNRYVRGILEACRLLRLPVIYPGRDLVTINRRAAAAVAFETDARGVLLFEAVVAVDRDFSLAPTFLDTVDRAGVVKADFITPEQATCLSQERQAGLSFADVATAVCDGYAKQFGLSLEPRQLATGERDAVTALTRQLGPQWIGLRSDDAALEHRGITWSQLGAFEAHCALDPEGAIARVAFAGDFIANPASIAALEDGLRACPPNRDAIQAVVGRIYSQPENYLLGIGALDTVAETIVRGLRS